MTTDVTLSRDDLEMYIATHRKALRIHQLKKTLTTAQQNALRPLSELLGGNVDLSGMDLKQMNLQLIDLRDANLKNTDMRGATLSGAILAGADLRGANLRRAVMQNTDFSKADLRETQLHDAQINDCTFVALWRRSGRTWEQDIVINLHNSPPLRWTLTFFRSWSLKPRNACKNYHWLNLTQRFFHPTIRNPIFVVHNDFSTTKRICCVKPEGVHSLLEPPGKTTLT